MIRYRTQPMGYVDGEFKSVINNRQRKKDLLANIREYIRDLKDDEVVDLISDASVMSAMILAGDYKNILVVTSSNPTHSEGDHLIPVIHKFNYGVGKMSVTTPKRLENRFGGLYEDLDVDMVEVDSFYHLGQDKIRLKHKGEPFDAVVLLGNESLTNGKHKLHEIKCSKNNFLVLSPNIHSSTKDMFMKWDELNSQNALQPSMADENTFAQIFLDQHKEVRKFLQTSSGFSKFRLSGTGSTIFYMDLNPTELEKTLKKIPTKWRHFFCEPLQCSPLLKYIT